MDQRILILPGYHGSGPAHWQTWVEAQRPNARRLSGVDWEAPVLSAWTQAARRSIQASSGPLWLVAHSFGCLTAVAASVGLAERIAGVLLVAPADPDRFSPLGVRPADRQGDLRSLAADLPHRPLPFPSLMVASSDDPWMSVDKAREWAGRWGSTLVDIGRAGHINIDSGFGPWPQGLAFLDALQTGQVHRVRPGSRRRDASLSTHAPAVQVLSTL